ncbi:MAG: saccharopine dehydrogenase NADP-binding domain-containing protein [Planctomycetota bacterium]|nr:saccharopine dehydrogenase NADP-binding domain-containing protein [Planctomycetota bacterium]
MSRVLIAGGRGFMGRRIIRLLKQALPKVEVLTAGRGLANDRVFDVHAPEDHYTALRGIDVFLNTVGPFEYDPRPVMRACLDNGVHYVDIAETHEFMAAAAALQAEGAACATVSGASSVPGLIQVFAQCWADSPPASIRAQLSIGTNNPGSTTLLRSMLSPIGRRISGNGVCFNHTWLRPHQGQRARRYGPYPCGLNALRLGDRDVPLQFGFGFDRRPYTLALWLLAPLVALTPRGLLGLAAALGNAVSPLARPLGTKIGILSIDQLDGSGEVIDSIEIRALSEGLDVPAWPSVWAIEALLNQPRSAGSLAELITPEQAKAKLSVAGYPVNFQ